MKVPLIVLFSEAPLLGALALGLLVEESNAVAIGEVISDVLPFSFPTTPLSVLFDYTKILKSVPGSIKYGQ